MQRFKKYIYKNKFYLIFPAVFMVLVLGLIVWNGSVIFNHEFLGAFGDQQLYYRLAYRLAHWEFETSWYTIGYPLLYLPLIILTGVSAHWESIMPLLIPLQSFVLMGTVIYLVFRTKTRRYAYITAGLMVLYYCIWLVFSQDALVKYNALGLIPLSEPLAIFLLISSYHIYLKYFRAQDPHIKFFVLFAGLMMWGILTRSVSVVLYAPLFVDMLLSGRLRTLLKIGLLMGIFYVPQLLYNYYCSGDWLYNGYTFNSARRAEKEKNIIEGLYGIRTNTMFSMHYFLVNVRELFVRYLPLLALAIGCFAYQKRNRRLVNLVLIFTVINLCMFLAYWWSKTGGLIDRFLLPNMFLLFYMYRNTLLEEKSLPMWRSFLRTPKSSVTNNK